MITTCTGWLPEQNTYEANTAMMFNGFFIRSITGLASGHHGRICCWMTDMKLIPLLHGLCTIVDDEDYDRLNEHLWFAVKSGKGTFYVLTHITGETGNRQNLTISRMLLSPGPGEIVDHINGITLDNRKENLRICTLKENSWNRRGKRNTSSKYKGVHWHKTNKSWQAGIILNGKYTHLGSFADEDEAGESYRMAAMNMQGEYAYENR